MRIWLKECRKKKGLTQAEVARSCCVGRSYYTQIELGERRPSPEIAKGIAKILDFKWTFFLMNDVANREMNAWFTKFLKKGG